MRGLVVIALYLVIMIAVIVGVDIAFFRGNLWARLIANISIFRRQ